MLQVLSQIWLYIDKKVREIENFEYESEN
jgi:hypothetical protein